MTLCESFSAGYNRLESVSKYACYLFECDFLNNKSDLQAVIFSFSFDGSTISTFSTLSSQGGSSNFGDIGVSSSGTATSQNQPSNNLEPTSNPLTQLAVVKVGNIVHHFV